MTLIFIDGSYYIFYRYFATLQWWKFKHTEDKDLLNEEELMNNNEFIDKFTELFEKKLSEIPKRLKIKDEYTIYIALDCSRRTIWRNEYIDNYKGTRINNTNIHNIFKLVMDSDLFKKHCYVKEILYLDCLEADDCIALSVKEICKKVPDISIYIITNDHDYLQLKNDNINLINLKYQQVGKNTTTNDPDKDLFLKAVCGDKSDNISSIFTKKRVGKKTAEKYYKKEDEFIKFCNDDNDTTYDKYKINMKLISFNEIPSIYVEAFMAKYSTVFQY